jgi:uncharacterized protein (TIGR03067 family)
MRSTGLLSSLAVVLLIAAAPAQNTDVRDDLERLQGGWSMILVFINGEELPPDQVKTGELIVDDDEYYPKLGANVEPSTFTVDGSKNPRAIDFTYSTGFQKGKTTKGIYKLEDDTLTICRGLTPDKERPTEFAAPTDSGLLLVVWRKSKTIGAERLKAKQLELKRFEATWRFVSVEVEGRMVPVEVLKEDKLVLKGKQFTSTIQGNTTQGVFKINPTAKPKSIDITFTDGPGKDNTQKGIYELEGDTQRICIAAPGKPRPSAFISKPASGHIIEVLEREKP